MLRRQGSAHTRRYTHKAEHTKGNMWPPRESCYLSGVRGWPPRREKRAAAGGWLVLRRQDGTHTRQCTPKAEHTQGGAHKRRFVATARVLLFKGRVGAGPRIERSELLQGFGWWSKGKAIHTQGSAHTSSSTQRAVRGHCTSLVIEAGCGGWPPRQAKRAAAGGGWRSTGNAVHTQGGAQKKAVCGQCTSLVI